jgi:hypothetical protein
MELTPPMPIYRSVLTDPPTDMQLNLLQSNPKNDENYSYNFITYIPKVDTLMGVTREDLEELISKIQVTKLLRQVDPEFSYPMSITPFDTVRSFLDYWETALKDFLKHAVSQTFSLVYHTSGRGL